MVEKNRCTGCGVCGAVCPTKAIILESDAEGFLYPVVQKERCTQCGLCQVICPLQKKQKNGRIGSCFGAKAKEEKQRELGSSGGIFPLLAANVLKRGGVVFGAALLPEGTVRHIGIERAEDLPKITRTKYVQSNLEEVWQRLRPLLQEGRQVLFCGTPCQAAAVDAFVQREEERKNLLLADLICYGVPSPGIWKEYVQLLEKEYGGKLQSFFFRDKRGRDNGHTCAAKIGGREYIQVLHRDRFCRTYFRNVNIRPSCFQCQYCTPKRSSDITLGDFWGIEQVKPGFTDGMGCSAVICHTPAGEREWNQIQEQVQWFACSPEEVANSQQPRLQKPVEPSPRRGLYMRLYRWLPLSLWFKLFEKWGRILLCIKN